MNKNIAQEASKGGKACVKKLGKKQVNKNLDRARAIRWERYRMRERLDKGSQA
jgi:hypothetical protein